MLNITTSYQTKTTPTFKGKQLTTKLPYRDAVNKIGAYCSDTYFFRDMRILEHMKKLIQKHFPNGTTIADFGCSNGEESRTISMLLSDINSNNRYQIKAFDSLADNIVEANNGIYAIGLNCDSFLNGPLENLTKVGIGLHKLFTKFFKNLNSKCFNEQIYKANDKMFENHLNFYVGNINDINSLMAKDKPGVVIFKNAWYHLMIKNNSELGRPFDYDLTDAQKVMKKIHNQLEENGLLVVGNLTKDHILGEFAFDEGIVHDSPFHKALKDAGFRPLLESASRVTPVNMPMGAIFEEVKVPTIWQKV